MTHEEKEATREIYADAWKLPVEMIADRVEIIGGVEVVIFIPLPHGRADEEIKPKSCQKND